MEIGQKYKTHRLLKIIRRKWQLYVLALPAVVSVFIFHYVPIYGIQIAFKDFRAGKGIFGSSWVGLKHFIRFWSYPSFWAMIKNTLSISLYSLATFPLSVILALMIHELDSKKLKRCVQMVTFAPHFISTVVACSIVMIFMRYDKGLINNIIEALGGHRIDFLTIPKYFSSIYVWSGVWQNLGWGTIIYLGALASVSPELIEAARIDGASRMGVMRHVNLPTILPTVITTLILSTGGILSVGFEKIYLLQNPLNMAASQVIATYSYQVGLEGGQFSYSAAIGLFNNVVNIIVIVTFNTISKRVTETSMW